MLPITPPDNVSYKKIADNKSEVVIGPCYPGYGVTIGNSLRRVLLSSLDGAAITGFKIIGVDHEFSSIANVKEDVVDIILNLKKVRFKINSQDEEQIKLLLNVSGKKKVTALDIEKNSQVAIANPDQLIATLTSKDAKLEMEIFIDSGRGYVTVEQREKEKLEIGTMAIDSLYSPVVNVSFRIESTRVGEMTDYEKLIMVIETDGAVTPKQAVDQAITILVSQFSAISQKDVKKAKKTARVSGNKRGGKELSLVDAAAFDSDPSATSSHSSLSNEAVRPQSRTAGPSGAQTRGADKQVSSLSNLGELGQIVGRAEDKPAMNDKEEKVMAEKVEELDKEPKVRKRGRPKKSDK